MGTKYLTIARLHKILGQLIEQGHSRVYVAVQKDTYEHALEESDGVVILDCAYADLECVPQCDDDGGTAFNKDGTERTRRTLVLRGNSWSEKERMSDAVRREMDRWSREEEEREGKGGTDVAEG